MSTQLADTDNVEFMEDAGQADHSQAVTDLLDQAVREAERVQMGTSELIGLFFFYAQSLVLDAREGAQQNDD